MGKREQPAAPVSISAADLQVLSASVTLVPLLTSAAFVPQLPLQLAMVFDPEQ